MKFCFWGEIGHALRGATVGGGELQMAMLGKALANEGHEVVVIDPFVKEEFTSPDGIRVLKVEGWNKGLPVLRILTHRIPALYKLFLSVKADYYYIRMRSYMHLLPYLASRKNKAKLVIGLASDFDVASYRKRLKYDYLPRMNMFTYLFEFLPDDLVYDFILKRADVITVQHKGQRRDLKKVKAKVAEFPNIFDFANVEENKPARGNYFVSVGSLTMLKGVDNLLTLSQLVRDDVPLVIVGDPRNKGAENYYEKLAARPNVTLRGRLNHADTIRMIAGSAALINVSKFEGFPNIFLEAWANGIPVISLNVDPGDVITEQGLGEYCKGDFRRMKECIENNVTKDIDGEKLVNYTRGRHDFTTAGKRFLNILGY